MKKIIHVIILFLLSNAAFCQVPPDFEDPNDDNPTDAPIGKQLPVLLIAAAFLGIYVIVRKKRQSA